MLYDIFDDQHIVLIIKTIFRDHKEQEYRSQYSEETTGWMARVSESDRGKKLFLLSKRPRPAPAFNRPTCI